MLAPGDKLSLPSEISTMPSSSVAQFSKLARQGGEPSRGGLLIVNADDWGRDTETTERMFECVAHGSISSVSAMVYMEDSERAAAIAKERGIDAGLHLNFTTRFSTHNCPSRLVEYQQEIAAYLTRRFLSRMVFHPGLVRSFEYVVKVQLDEFCRLYGTPPERIDGHHHMHLCANVLLGRLLPPGTVVRRNFAFQHGEKSLVNRLYRRAVDHRLAQRHRLVDFLFSLTPLEPKGRLERIRSLARESIVEVETHPVKADEYRFLKGDEVARWTDGVPIASRFSVPRRSGAVAKGE
jgi:chitin disaccharide deacetylase